MLFFTPFFPTYVAALIFARHPVALPIFQNPQLKVSQSAASDVSSKAAKLFPHLQKSKDFLASYLADPVTEKNSGLPLSEPLYKAMVDSHDSFFNQNHAGLVIDSELMLQACFIATGKSFTAKAAGQPDFDTMRTFLDLACPYVREHADFYTKQHVTSYILEKPTQCDPDGRVTLISPSVASHVDMLDFINDDNGVSLGDNLLFFKQPVNLALYPGFAAEHEMFHALWNKYNSDDTLYDQKFDDAANECAADVYGILALIGDTQDDTALIEAKNFANMISQSRAFITQRELAANYKEAESCQDNHHSTVALDGLLANFPDLKSLRALQQYVRGLSKEDLMKFAGDIAQKYALTDVK